MKAFHGKQIGLCVLYVAFLSVFYILLYSWGTFNEYLAYMLSGFTFPPSYEIIRPSIVTQQILLFVAPLLALPPFFPRTLTAVERLVRAYSLLLLPIIVGLLVFMGLTYRIRPSIRNYSIWSNKKCDQASILFDTRPFLDFYSSCAGTEDETLQTRLIPKIKAELGESVQIRIRDTSSDTHADSVFFAQYRYQKIHGENADMPSVFLTVHRLGCDTRITLYGLEEIDTRWKETVLRCKYGEQTP